MERLNNTNYTKYIGSVVKGIKPGDLVDIVNFGFCEVFTFNNELYLRNGYNEVVKYDNDDIATVDEHKYYKKLKIDESDFYIERVKE